MKFHFSGQSQLCGRTVYQEIARYCFAHDLKAGQKEHVLCYRSNIPDETIEPDLYKDAKVSKKSTGEVHLTFEGLDEMVMLMFLEEDNKFRTENPEIVAQNEILRIDE